MQNIEKIEKIFRLLGSPNDNEALAAIRAMTKILSSQGKSFSDLSNHLFKVKYPTDKEFKEDFDPSKYKYQTPYTDEPQVRMVAMTILRHSKKENCQMTEWEKTFIADIYTKNIMSRRSPSAKQREILLRMFSDYCAGDQQNG